MATLKEKLQQAAVKIEALRLQLSDAEKEFDALFKQVASGKAKRQRNEVLSPDDILNADLSKVDTSDLQIADLLDSQPEKEWDYDSISQKLPSIPRASVRVYLYKLKKDGRAQKVGRGKWKAFSPQN